MEDWLWERAYHQRAAPAISAPWWSVPVIVNGRLVREGARERERDTSMRERTIDRLPSEHPRLRTEPVTQACALTRNLARNLLVHRFIQEVEHALGLGPAKQCPLREFLTVYIKNIFLNQVLAEINKEIEGVTKTSDPLKILANADTMKVLGVQRPLLQDTSQHLCPSSATLSAVQSTFHVLGVLNLNDIYSKVPRSTIIVEKTVQDLLNLMHDLSAYSDQFLNMVCVKLQEYKDTCTAAYSLACLAYEGLHTGPSIQVCSLYFGSTIASPMQDPVLDTVLLITSCPCICQLLSERLPDPRHV
ncbi:Exocyst complex component 4 [Myotis davidii]|uniref:Exocyst complex component Sec8 n=1 Tax=Myotis davidii TaxID=225400 RepID=L5MB58_MYODS|nr:Exocyst complex component 4 [Myotis davidii]